MMLNIKRFYFSNDPLSYRNRTKVKNYYDEQGNIVYTEELFKFNDVYVSEPVKTKQEDTLYFGTGNYGKDLKLLYQHLPVDKNDKYAKIAEEEYPNFIKLDNQYNIVNNQVYDGPVFLDENENFICSLGRNLGFVISTNPILTINKSLYRDKHYSDDSKTYTIYQTKANKTITFERTLPRLYVGNEIYLKNKDEIQQCFVGNEIEIDTLIRTMKKDIVTIEYVANDNVVFKESYYIDEKTIYTNQTEYADEHFLGHKVSYTGLYNENGEYRELWFEDLGVVEVDEKDTSTSISEPETKGGK